MNTSIHVGDRVTAKKGRAGQSLPWRYCAHCRCIRTNRSMPIVRTYSPVFSPGTAGRTGKRSSRRCHSPIGFCCSAYDSVRFPTSRSATLVASLPLVSRELRKGLVDGRRLRADIRATMVSRGLLVVAVMIVIPVVMLRSSS